MQFQVIRDDGGYAEAIAYGDRHIVRLVVGATRNEEEAERVVRMLNASEDAANRMHLIASYCGEDEAACVCRDMAQTWLDIWGRDYDRAGT